MLARRILNPKICMGGLDGPSRRFGSRVQGSITCVIHPNRQCWKSVPITGRGSLTQKTFLCDMALFDKSLFGQKPLRPVLLPFLPTSPNPSSRSSSHHDLRTSPFVFNLAADESVPCMQDLKLTPARKVAALKIHFVIIGGGIGGLGAAVALRRVGHQVTVIERDSDVYQVISSVPCFSPTFIF